jgi:hypothetical protein
LVAQNYVAAPDLVVEAINTTGDLAVVIANQGDRPVIDGFWVDLYIDPATAPTSVNEVWNDLCDAGVAWGVTKTIEVGESLTLTLTSPFYSTTYSDFDGTLPAGATLYAQVDSASLERNTGGVTENHEMLGLPYNNIFGPVNVAQMSTQQQTATTGGGQPADLTRLPGR